MRIQVAGIRLESLLDELALEDPADTIKCVAVVGVSRSVVETEQGEGE
jgi:hypothetical protein